MPAPSADPNSADLYERLGVERDAPREEISRAFRRAAREAHPDVNRDDPRAEERFKRLGEAHDILTDDQARGQYDAASRQSGGCDISPEELMALLEALIAARGGAVSGSYSTLSRNEDDLRAASAPDLSENEQVRLARSFDHDTLLALVNRPGELADEAQVILAKDYHHPDVQLALAKRKGHMPDEAQLTLAKEYHHPEIQLAMAERDGHLIDEAQVSLAGEYHHPEIQLAMARRAERMPDEAQVPLAGNYHHPEIQLAMAHREDLSDQSQVTLAGSRSHDIQLALAERMYVCEAACQVLGRSGHADVRKLSGVAPTVNRGSGLGGLV
jgi:hypothetical protein